jgi:hypothetical protein
MLANVIVGRIKFFWGVGLLASVPCHTGLSTGHRALSDVANKKSQMRKKWSHSLL